MAKNKQKRKKTGLAKRKQDKQNKKRLLKKKIKASKPVKKKMSAARFKENIKKLPGLIFEPELREIAFTPEQIKEATDNYDAAPDQIEALADSEFIEELGERINAMKSRFEAEGDVDKMMMTHAVDYFMTQENGPVFVNQIVVAMFSEALMKMENPEEVLDADKLNLLIAAYETAWKERISDKLKGDQETDGHEHDFEEEDEDEDVMIFSPFDPLIEEFGRYLKDESDIDEEKADKAVEDVEALLGDYLEEKKVSELDDLTPRKARMFLDGWFPRVMHPTEEDMAAMIESLEMFFRFAEIKEKISARKTEDFLKILEEKKNAE